MENFDFNSELIRAFSENGLADLVDGEKAEKFRILTERMLEENEKYNLTAIKEPKKIILNHYVDCAVLAKFIPMGKSLCDIGCGAGFPTLPLAIVRPDLKITGIDSTAKRIAYVNETAKMLSLTGVTAIAMRAEEGARLEEFRETFDFATARAVAAMRILSELCLPYVKVGGKMIAMKGRSAEEELSEASRAIELLSGEILNVENINLSYGGETISHPLITVKKTKSTQKTYPRPYAQILKKPL